MTFSIRAIVCSIILSLTIISLSGCTLGGNGDQQGSIYKSHNGDSGQGNGNANGQNPDSPSR